MVINRKVKEDTLALLEPGESPSLACLSLRCQEAEFAVHFDRGNGGGADEKAGQREPINPRRNRLDLWGVVSRPSPSVPSTSPSIKGMEPGAKSEAKQGEAGSGAAGGGGGSSGSKVYHERQRLQFCLLHALNNLMQVTPISLISTIMFTLGSF